MSLPERDPHAYSVKAIPGAPFAAQVSSKSKPGTWHRVDWFRRESGELAGDCDCPAFNFHQKCSHVAVALDIARASQSFQEGAQRMGGLAAVPDPEPDGPANVETAIAAIYAEVGYVQKRKAESLSYTFAGEADIIEALRPAMVKHGVTSRVVRIENVVHEQIPVGSNGKIQQRTTLLATVRFAHGASGTYADVQALGEGMDSGDKGANKASTGAYKYALRQTFCLETGNDPDDSRPEQESNGNGHQGAPAARSAPKSGGGGTDEMAAWNALQAAMKEKGINGRDVAALLPKRAFTKGAVAEWLNAEPSRTIGTLISAAIGGGNGQPE